MKGLGHFHGARYSRALAEFVLAEEQDERVADISRFWMANTYLAQREYAHAYLELRRLAGVSSSRLRARDIADKERTCEQHLNADLAKMIRELAARRTAAAK
jgi:hypothetical protein